MFGLIGQYVGNECVECFWLIFNQCCLIVVVCIVVRVGECGDNEVCVCKCDGGIGVVSEVVVGVM